MKRLAILDKDNNVVNTVYVHDNWPDVENPKDRWEPPEGLSAVETTEQVRRETVVDGVKHVQVGEQTAEIGAKFKGDSFERMA